MSKWRKIDPTDLRPGDKFKRVLGETTIIGVVNDGPGLIRDTSGYVWKLDGEWFRRNPKWSKPTKVKRIDPDYIRVGDRVQAVDLFNRERIPLEPFTVKTLDDTHLNSEWTKDLIDREWFLLHRVKPTRPDEPPVGSFFRVSGSDDLYYRFSNDCDGLGYYMLITPDNDAGTVACWEYVVKPGDTITMLKLVEDKPRTNGGVPRMISQELDAIKARHHRANSTYTKPHYMFYSASDIPALVAAVEAVLAIHRNWQIHDCDCEYHTAESECDSEVMYTVCRECCTSNGYHTEECAGEHIHGPTHPICPTVQAIHQALGEGEK